MKLTDEIKKKLFEVSKQSSEVAAQALSQMINKEVKVDFQNLSLEPLNEIKDLKEDMIVSLCKLEGDYSGNVLLAFLQSECISLMDMMVYQGEGKIKSLTNEAKEAFNELNNIVGGAYVSELANYLTSTILIDPPSFIGDLTEIQNSLISDLQDYDKDILLVQSVLDIENRKIDGLILVLLDNTSLNNLLTKIK